MTNDTQPTRDRPVTSTRDQPRPTTRDRPAPRERERNPFTKSSGGGRVLSAMMLPFFLAMPPHGFGVLTTKGRRTGKTRRKCVRVVRDGDKAYLVMLGPALLGRTAPESTAGWLWNIRADPNVRLRIRGGTFAGMAHEIEDQAERQRAKEVYCSAVHRFDYVECDFHTGWRPTRDKVERMHRHWFDTGVPLAVDLAP